MSKQGAADKRKQPQKREIRRRFESGKSQREVMPYTKLVCQLSVVLKKWKDQLRSFMVSSESVKDDLK